MANEVKSLVFAGVNAQTMFHSTHALCQSEQCDKRSPKLATPKQRCHSLLHKFTTACIASTLLAGSLFPAIAKSADFRGVSWGQEYNSVLDSEKQKPAKEFPMGVVYRAELGGEKCALVYIFANKNKTLTNAAYYCRRPINKAPMLGDLYAKLQAELIAQYGKIVSSHVENAPPTAEQIQNIQSGKTPEGEAIVKTGGPLDMLNLYVFYISYLSWEAPRTSIRLDIEADTGGTANVILLYTQKIGGNSKTIAATSDTPFAYTEADRYKDLIKSQADAFADEEMPAKSNP